MNRKTCLLKTYWLVFVIFCAISFSGFAQQGWQWGNPLPQGNTLYDVHLFDANTAIAVGEAGTLMKTTDGGNSWAIQHHVGGITTALRSVAFFDSAIGIVVGDFGTILITKDGGITWSKLDNVTKSSLLGICALSKDIWLAVSWEATLLRSDDEGVSWTEQPVEDSFHSITAIDTLTAIAVGGAASAMKTINGGLSWSYQHYLCGIIDGSLKDVDFIDANTGIAVGSYEYGYILRTDDGGETWTKYKGIPRYTFRAVAWADSNTCIAVADGGHMMRTDDAGLTWINKPYMASNSLLSVKFLNDQIGLTVGEGGIILTTADGGEHWKSLTSGTTKGLLDVFFITHKIGVAVGVEGAILRTEDGGISWQERSYNTRENLFGVHFTSADTGTVVGTNGIILHTSDGGENWQVQPSGTKLILKDVYFSDSNTGTAVGQHGIILRTIDSGNSWVKQASGTTADLERVFFTSKDTGVIVGYDHTILHTTDGGENWSKIDSGINKDLYNVYFFDSMTGIIAGDDGAILRTVNGGLNWELQNSGTKSHLTSISFIDKNIGAIAGGGVILHTIDGGQSWIYNRQFKPTNNGIAALAVLDTNVAIVVGEYGTILRTTTPVVSSVKENLLPQPENLLKRFVLQQNYPNPFNAATEIRYQLPEDCQVRLAIYTVLGQHIRTLVDQRQAAGDYAVNWDGKDGQGQALASGIYVYQIKMASLVANKKMVLIR